MNDKGVVSNTGSLFDLKEEFIRLKSIVIPSFEYSLNNYLDSSIPRRLYQDVKKDLAAFFILALSSKFENLRSLNLSDFESVKTFLVSMKNGEFGIELANQAAYLAYVLNYAYPKIMKWEDYARSFITRTNEVLEVFNNSVLELHVVCETKIPEDKSCLIGLIDSDLQLISECEQQIDDSLLNLEDLEFFGSNHFKNPKILYSPEISKMGGGYDYLNMIMLLPKVDLSLSTLLFEISKHFLIFPETSFKQSVCSGSYLIFKSLKNSNIDFDRFSGYEENFKSNLSQKTLNGFVEFAKKFIEETKGILSEIRADHDRRLGAVPTQDNLAK